MIDDFQQPVSDSKVSSLAKESYETKIDQAFVVQWIFACIIGYALGMSVPIVIAEKVGYSFWDTSVKALGLTQELGKYNYIFASALMGASFGGITSFCQWVVLRRFIKNAIRWVLVGTILTSAGIALNSIAYTVISSKVVNLSVDDPRYEASILVLTVLTALALGFLEWIILRRRFSNSAWWIGIRTISNATALILSLLALSISITGISRFLNNFLLGVVCGMLIGTISGFALYSFSKNHQVLAG